MKGVSRYRKIWLWVLVIGFVLLLLSTNSGSRPTWNPAEQLVIELTAPIQRFIKQSIEVVESIWLNYFHLVEVRRKNLILEKETDALRMENSRYRELLATHERLQKLLRFRQTINRQALAAQVIGLDPTGWFKSVIIDKGKVDGIKLDMPVVNASGVVGRIVSISPNYAKVLLIIDQNSAVDCLVQRSRDRGMIKGLSEERCNFDYVVTSSDVVNEDIVVTSGLGGVFPKGIPVGRVLSVRERSGELFKDVYLTGVLLQLEPEDIVFIITPSDDIGHESGFSNTYTAVDYDGAQLLIRNPAFNGFDLLFPSYELLWPGYLS